jgi:hypothetical protein
MKTKISVQDLLFGVDQVPVEAVIGTNAHTRRVTIPGKKALINQHSGQILGVVSRDYRVAKIQLNTMRHLRKSKPKDTPSRTECLKALSTDFYNRLTCYQTDPGPKA